MKKSNKFSLDARERAVRLVQEHRSEYSSLWAAIEFIARVVLPSFVLPLFKFVPYAGASTKKRFLPGFLPIYQRRIPINFFILWKRHK